MFNIQSKHNSVIHMAIIIVTIIVSNFVYADEQSFIYASDLNQGQSNSEQEIWQYQHEVPLAYQNKKGSFPIQYTYAPPTQKIGSNPISNPQHKAQFPLNNYADNRIIVAGKTYNYPPAAQKIGSNPFIKPKLQYAISHNIEPFFTSSCDCEKPSNQGIIASY